MSATSDNKTSHLSAVYDSQVRKTIPYYDLFHDETINLVKAVNPRPGNWLDTGCGTGTLALKAIKEFPETKFILADPSPTMLEQARKKLAGYQNVRFIESDTSSLADLPPLDVITAIQSHHYLEEKGRRKATEKCHDLLVDGGLYVTFENIRPFSEEGVRSGLYRWGLFQISRGKSRADVEDHIARFGTEYFPLTVEAHLNLLRSAGFKTVEILWHSMMQAGFWAVK